MATIVPSLLSDVDIPLLSATASPSMSEPTCDQLPEVYLYTLTCPALAPFPSLYLAPIATIVPSSLNDTQ